VRFASGEADIGRTKKDQRPEEQVQNQEPDQVEYARRMHAMKMKAIGEMFPQPTNIKEVIGTLPTGESLVKMTDEEQDAFLSGVDEAWKPKKYSQEQEPEQEQEPLWKIFPPSEDSPRMSYKAIPQTKTTPNNKQPYLRDLTYPPPPWKIFPPSEDSPRMSYKAIPQTKTTPNE
jgi:hypothetical protein